MLETELATYEREKKSLLKDEGKFVLISGENVAGIFEAYGDALQIGYDRFGLVPFLVKQIALIERVNRFTRDISTCPT